MKTSGYTLIEMAIVIAMLAIFTMLAVHAWNMQNCKNLRKIKTDRTICTGSAGHLTCEPEYDYICLDK